MANADAPVVEEGRNILMSGNCHGLAIHYAAKQKAENKKDMACSI